MKKIMLVDDNILSVEGIEKSIDWNALDAGITHIRYSGKSAVEALKEEPVDVIISDIEMPDLDGISMAKQAISLNPFVKVILISAYDRFDYAKRAIRIGVCDYIEKPIDYSYLTEKIQAACTLIDQEKHNMDLLSQSRPIMVEKFYNNLLHYSGKEAAFHLASYRDYLDLKLDYQFYGVALFDIENAPDLKAVTGVPQYEMLLYNLYDLIHQVCLIFDHHYILKGFDGLTLILCQNSSNVNHVLQSIHKAAALVVENYLDTDVSINIGIGSIVSDLWNTHVSYKSALHALEYRFFFPQKNIFDTREALGRELSLEPVSELSEEELIRLICQKDFLAIEDWIKNFSMEIMQKYPTKSLICIRIYSLLGRILKFLYELNVDVGDLEESIIGTYSSLDSFHTGEQLFSWLYGICTGACQKLSASLKTYHDQLCDTVLSYIRENYENSDLCLHDIAKYVNVSPSYLSALFKKSTRLSISDTISATRIDAACQYLENSMFSLKEISEKCGYANQYYFSTSFKKKMGVSPSVYRNEKNITFQI